MRSVILAAFLLSGSVRGQQALDPNSIVVTASRSVVLVPTETYFVLTVSADYTVTLDQILAALDMGLTAQDLVSISSYPIGPYPAVPSSISRINYAFRLGVPIPKVKDTIDKLEKLRKSLDTGMDLTYSTITAGPTASALQDAHNKALPDLIADARKQAQALADAAQLKLGAIQAVSEGYTYPSGTITPVPANMTFSVIVRFAAQ